MALVLHNTLTGVKEPFAPRDSRRVTMYVCGPTVYNYVHVGNARPVVVFDVLYRLLRGLYPNVVYARNVTDIDDKITAAAAASGETIGAVAERYTEAFHRDVAALGALPPDVEPFATAHVPRMIAMTARLIERGHAYEADGHVLFHVPSMPAYGRLSKRNRGDVIAGARVEVAPYKKDPADFVLWKPSTADLPGWDSPWGFGRPGWHLECSAMIEAHLGDSIDIHGGGQDLVFPHHENEIAQSVCAHESLGDAGEFVRCWLHNGYVTVDGEKMSKSVGNFFTLREILEVAPGEAVRYALLSGHYRKPLDWSVDALNRARASLDRLYRALQRAPEAPVDATAGTPDAVLEALLDDLNTPRALAELHALATALNSSGRAARGRLKSALVNGARLMGLLTGDPERWFRWTAARHAGPDDAEVEALVEQRAAARARGDFAAADRIRARLAERGVALEDSARGTAWHRAADLE